MNHGPRRATRTVCSARLVAVLSAAAGLLCTSVGAAAAAEGVLPPTTAEQEAGMTAGAPFRDPAGAAEAWHGGEITITLNATDTRLDLSGRRVWGQSYNGSYIAPTIRFAPGARVAVHLVNHLSVATNLHFHGLHVSPARDDGFLCVAPGRSVTYHLGVAAGHTQGTYWYHSHAMGTTCPDSHSGRGRGNVENQIFGGLSGALIVGDDRRLLPRALRHVVTHTLVLKDAQIDAGGHILQNTADTAINSNNPTVRLVNGQLRPVLTMRPNQTQLWRLVNAGADIFYRLRLDGCRFTVVDEDGVPVARIKTAETLLMPPGKRYDVLVTAGPHPGQTWLRTLAYNNGPQGDQYPDTLLAQVRVAGAAVHRRLTLSGSMPTAPRDLTDAEIARQREVVLSESPDGLTFFIGGRPFAMDRSIFRTPARLGTVEQWTLRNASGEDHPFHLHTSSFQVMSINGKAVPYTHRQDTVLVPHAAHGARGTVVIRIPFYDHPGRWLFHCHIAAHEDNGMMSFINVVP